MRRFVSAVVLSSLVLAACGSEREQSVTPAATVARAATTTTNQSSARVTLRWTIGRTTLTGGGVIDLRRSAARYGLDVSAAGRRTHIDEIVQGSTVYMKVPPAEREHGRRWLRIDLGRVVGADVTAETDPSQVLHKLELVGRVVTRGRETIGGRATRRYRAEIDYRRIARTGPAAERRIARKILASSASPREEIDVWIDGQGLIRREVSRSAIETIAMDIPEYGVDAGGIAPPPKRLTFDAKDSDVALTSGY